MALDFFPIPPAFDDYYQGMVIEIPAGNFYLQAFENVPLSVRSTKFFLVTDVSSPIEIYINNRLARTHIPRGEVDTIELPLVGAPSLNYIVLRNGIDDPVRIMVAATHLAKQFYVYAAELFEYAGFTVDTYNDLIHSVWSSFMVEYQLPWQEDLPDVRSMKQFAVKTAANCLYGEYGQQGGVTDLIAGFCSSTPVIDAPVNPELWQPDLYQPQSSGKDVAGFNAHVWLPNVCLNQWLAFVTLMNNRYDYEFRYFDENKVVLQLIGTDLLEQHLFDNTAAQCSLRGLLEFLGCMDAIAAGGVTTVWAIAALCAWANAFDTVVEAPGIGGGFFDSETDFDGDYGDFDSIYDLDPFTDYWVGVNTSKIFDFGSCLDTYSAEVTSKDNTDCCQEGPDVLLFTTELIESSVESPVVPNNPLFGGDSPGLLYNPYLGILNT
jgi:hypothetical protein